MTEVPEKMSGQCRWIWEITDPWRGGGAGDLAKLFKNETVKEPGIFATGAPPSEATLMAREVIQNSWDAASELQRTSAAQGLPTPQFSISFDFFSSTGDERKELVQAIDLAGLQNQLGQARTKGSISNLGLARTTCLEHLEDEERALPLLRIVESGTTGMYGPFDGAKSKMFLALISLGYTVKAAGSGGSYGYGKAGLIAGSAIRTVFAYTCFRPQGDDQIEGVPVTRRFLGMTYWGQHDLEGKSYTGFARLGAIQERGVAPLINEDADRMAVRLGLETRSAEDPAQLGTTFMLVDPVVSPQDLTVAIERNWWPAIHERHFVPVVSDRRDAANPITIIPRPRRNPALAPFVRAYEVATVPQDNDVPHEFSANLGQLPPGLGGSRIGQLGIVADLAGWSFADAQQGADDDSGLSHTSLIALTRGPRMVVEYLQPHGMKDRPPYVRGVFVADEAIDDLLRQTEPRAHDAWVRASKNLEEGVDERAPRVADLVLKGITREAKKFQQRLRPPLPDPSKVKLTTLSALFKKLARGSGGGVVPPSGDKNVLIRTSLRTEITEAGNVKASGTIRIALATNFTEAESAHARLKVTYRFLENDKSGDPVELMLSGSILQTDPDEDNFYSVTLSHEFQEINFVSCPYSADWSGRLSINVTDLVASIEFGAQK